MLTAEELCRKSGGSINFPAFLRLVTHLPWHHLLTLELQKEDLKKKEERPRKGFTSTTEEDALDKGPPKRLQAPPMKKKQVAPPKREELDFISRAQERIASSKPTRSSPPKRFPSPPGLRKKEVGNDFMARAQERLSEPTNPSLNRKAELLSVFRIFDLDGSGFVETSELQVLGEARKTLGHKKRVWTPEKNAQMIENMDSRNPDGKIDSEEFAAYFLKTMRSKSDAEFMQTLLEFKACAPNDEE